MFSKIFSQMSQFLSLKFLLQRGLNINVSRTVAEEDLTDPGWGRTGKVQVQRGEAELDLDFTCTTSAGVARGSPPPTPLKSTKAKSRYNEAKPILILWVQGNDWGFLKMDWSDVLKVSVSDQIKREK